MTAPYSVGDRVEILKRKVWTPGEVVEVNTHHSPPIMYRVLRDSGGCVWGGREMLRRPVERRSLKLATPEVSEEADIWEAARERSTGSVRADNANRSLWSMTASKRTDIPQPELHAVPKVKTPRSRSHLGFVRSLPCAWCGSTVNVEASHHGLRGTSIKASDYGAIPLCGIGVDGAEGCHTHHTNHHGLPKSSMDADQTDHWFTEQALKVCAARLEER